MSPKTRSSPSSIKSDAGIKIRHLYVLLSFLTPIIVFVLLLGVMASSVGEPFWITRWEQFQGQALFTILSGMVLGIFWHLFNSNELGQKISSVFGGILGIICVVIAAFAVVHTYKERLHEEALMTSANEMLAESYASVTKVSSGQMTIEVTNGCFVPYFYQDNGTSITIWSTINDIRRQHKIRENGASPPLLIPIECR